MRTFFSRIPIVVVAGLFVISAIAVVVVLFNQERLLTDGKRALFFLGTPVAGLLTASLLFYAPDNIRTTGSALVLAVGMAVYGAEAYFLVRLQQIRTPAHVPQEVRFDTRSILDVVRDERRQRKDAFPVNFPMSNLKLGGDGALHSIFKVSGAEVLPLGSVARKNTVLCNESGEYVSFVADRYGFNNNDAVWDKPVRAVVVGDSFVLGFCVESSSTLAATLDRHAGPALGLGIAGIGPLGRLALLKEFGPALRPPVIVWLHFEGNDMSDLEIEKRSRLLTGYMNDGFSTKFIERFDAINDALAKHLNQMVESDHSAQYLGHGTLQHLVSFITFARVRELFAVSSTTNRSDVHFYRSVLSRAKRTVDSWGGDLLFVFLPGLDSIVAPPDPGSANERTRAEVMRILKEQGIRSLDLRVAMANHPDPRSLFPFRSYGHLNASGHEFVGRLIADNLNGPRKD